MKRHFLNLLKSFNFLALVGLFSLGGVRPNLAFADHLLETHALVCDESYPCPPELTRRIDFWIEVFHRYRLGEIVLHDSENPERVYDVFESARPCTARQEPRLIRNRRKKIHSRLLGLARKMKTGKETWTEEELHLLRLFPEGKAKDLRRAARNIRCQQGNRERFLEGLRRSGAFRNYIVEVLRSEGLPEDIQYLPFVESSYNPKAYSRVGAAGLWQIMPRTARKLGLSLNSAVDERFDPFRSTHAAAKYLRNAYRDLEKRAKKYAKKDEEVALGPFVITSYNYGLAGMRRAMRRVGPNYVEVLRKYRGRRFRTAVKNFYASFLAARHVARHAGHYFGKVDFDPAWAFDTIVLPSRSSVKRLAEKAEISISELKALNPAVNERTWKGRRLVPKGFELRLPKKKEGWAPLLAELIGLPAEQLQYASEPYRVRRGDTPCGIARRFSVSCRDFLETNELSRRSIIRIRQIVTIPGKGPIVTAQPAITVAAAPTPTETPAEAKVEIQKTTVTTKPEPTPTLTTTPTPTPSPKEIVTQAIEETIEDLPAQPKVASENPEKMLEAFGTDKNLFVSVSEAKGKNVYAIRVEAEETLGHYAEWLDIGYATRIRRLNKIRLGSTVRLGQRLLLPIETEEQQKQFESKRVAYHQTLEDEWKEHFRIVGKEPYKVKRGDSGWTIANDSQIPLWLLKRFNPEIFTRSPRIGDQVDIPVVEPKKSGETPP